jgi:hypothetical protein
MKNFISLLVLLLVIAATGHGQDEQVLKSFQLAEEAIQGHMAVQDNPFQPNVEQLTTHLPLDSCVYMTGPGKANSFSGALKEAFDFACTMIATSNHRTIEDMVERTCVGLDSEVVADVKAKTTFKVDAVTVRLAHMLSYTILSLDQNGMFTVVVKVGWNKKYGDFEEIVIREIEKLEKELKLANYREQLEKAKEMF